jgi:para-aminobenzoate synthetase component 1
MRASVSAAGGPPQPLAGAGEPRVKALPRWIDPLAALRAVRHRRRPVLLYSGLAGSHPEARHSILAWDPLATIAVAGETVTITPEEGASFRPWSVRAADPFPILRDLLPAEGTARPGLPFGGGAIGYLGYGLRSAAERLDRTAPEPLGLPDAWFGLYDAALVFDHSSGTVHAIELPRPGTRGGEERGVGDVLAAASAGPPAADVDGSAASPSAGSERAGARARTGTPRAGYEAAVREVLARIARGDLYQVNLSHRIEAPLGETPADLFARLMRRNPAPFSAYLDAGPFQLLSASPERFVALRGDRARSSPIKGTRPRGAFPEEDLLHADDLRHSAKDRAENVMIADLVRNDLGRVCRPGSVVVESLCRLESFATVHHLVTTVAGRLRPDRDRFDLLRALFPGGSMTGAPKVAAMQTIAALEREERGPYSGAIGYLSRDGALDFNIVIRTLACGGGRAHFRVGGGIVADSDPEREWLETLDKARALLEVLGARLDPAAAPEPG